jgi:hypothetical protein
VGLEGFEPPHLAVNRSKRLLSTYSSIVPILVPRTGLEPVRPL